MGMLRTKAKTSERIHVYIHVFQVSQQQPRPWSSDRLLRSASTCIQRVASQVCEALQSTHLTWLIAWLVGLTY